MQNTQNNSSTSSTSTPTAATRMPTLFVPPPASRDPFPDSATTSVTSVVTLPNVLDPPDTFNVPADEPPEPRESVPET